VKVQEKAIQFNWQACIIWNSLQQHAK